MSSLRALLAAYDLDPSDTIFVDAGQYDLLGNIVLTAQDGGVTIQGPLVAGHEAVLDRGNTGAGSYVFELVDADDVTLRNLTITGAQFGVSADQASGSDRVTIADNTIRDNGFYGVSFPNGGGESLTIAGNTVLENSNTGINVGDDGFTIIANTVSGHSTGILASSPGDTTLASAVSDDTVFGNSTGNDAWWLLSGRSKRRQPITTCTPTR